VKLGGMPVGWSGAAYLEGQIWRYLGFLPFASLLLWLELEVEDRSIVPFNKTVV
jgi:hypothetical protein